MQQESERNLAELYPRVWAVCVYCSAHAITHLCGPGCSYKHEVYCPHFGEEVSNEFGNSRSSDR